MLIASYSQSLIWYEIFYAVCLGLGIGICYIIPMILGWEFFPTKKGFVSGMIMCGFGFAAFIYGFVA